jgi:hypothetical protein
VIDQPLKLLSHKDLLIRRASFFYFTELASHCECEREREREGAKERKGRERKE